FDLMLAGELGGGCGPGVEGVDCAVGYLEVRHASEHLSDDVLFHGPGPPVLALDQAARAAFLDDEVNSAIGFCPALPLDFESIGFQERGAEFFELVPVDFLQGLTDRFSCPRGRWLR